MSRKKYRPYKLRDIEEIHQAHDLLFHVVNGDLDEYIEISPETRCELAGVLVGLDYAVSGQAGDQILERMAKIRKVMEKYGYEMRPIHEGN